MDYDTSMRVLRVRMWELGHSFSEIDDMSLVDMGDIISYWSQKSRIEQKRDKQRQAKKK